MLTAWNWVAFQGRRVFGSEVIPMTRLPPAAPAAPVVSDGVGVPLHAATRARAAAPAVTPSRVRTRRTGERWGDMRALLGQGAFATKVLSTRPECNFLPIASAVERRGVRRSR